MHSHKQWNLSSNTEHTLPNQTAEILFFCIEHLYLICVQNLREVLHMHLCISTIILAIVEAFIVYFHTPWHRIKNHTWKIPKQKKAVCSVHIFSIQLFITILLHTLKPTIAVITYTSLIKKSEYWLRVL